MGVVHKHLFDLHEDSHDFGATNLAQISQAELSEWGLIYEIYVAFYNLGYPKIKINVFKQVN